MSLDISLEVSTEEDEEEPTLHERFKDKFPRKRINYIPLNGRILVAMGRYGATSNIILPQDRQDSTALLNIGKVVAVAPGITNIVVGDWVEVPRNLIASQSSGINDLRLKNEFLEYFICWMLNTQIVGKIEFPEGGEPCLLSQEEFQNVKHELGL